MNRHVVCFEEYTAAQVVDYLNGYCCNKGLEPAQIQVIDKRGSVTIIAIVEDKQTA